MPLKVASMTAGGGCVLGRPTYFYTLQQVLQKNLALFFRIAVERLRAEAADCWPSIGSEQRVCGPSAIKESIFFVRSSSSSSAGSCFGGSI